MPAAKLLSAEAIKKFPDDGKFYMMYGLIAQQENNLLEAEKYYIKAASLEENRANIVAFVGNFYLAVLKNPEKAVAYYLRTYFIDPQAYDGEHVEVRVSNMSQDLAEKEFTRQLKNRVSLQLIARHENPVIAGLAITKMGENWDEKYIGTLVELMGHDDPDIRAAATDILKKQTDKKFDPQLKKLLTDSDLRKRGLAAYIAVNHWQKASYPLMQKWLKEEAQLIRFDAISALLLEGEEEAKKIVINYRNKETNPRLQKLLEEVK